MDIKALGRRLAKIRVDAGFTMESLHAASGVAENTILAIESGRGNPTLKTLEALTTALGVSLAELLEPPPVPLPKNTKARAVAAANPQDLAAGLEFLSAFARQIPDIQLVAMAIVFEDLAYLKKVSPEYREQLARLSQQLLKALG